MRTSFGIIETTVETAKYLNAASCPVLSCFDLFQFRLYSAVLTDVRMTAEKHESKRGGC